MVVALAQNRPDQKVRQQRQLTVGAVQSFQLALGRSHWLLWKYCHSPLEGKYVLRVVALPVYIVHRGLDHRGGDVHARMDAQYRSTAKGIG